MSQKYKYLNNFALIHLVHPKSTSNNYRNNNNFYLGVLFFGNILLDYHIKNNPMDIVIFFIVFIKKFLLGEKIYFQTFIIF